MSGVEKHYFVEDIESRLLTALRAAGFNTEKRLSALELGALDHFHTGGLRASLVLQDLAQIQADDRVLDLGAGLAGAARMLAESPGCRVDCVELSEDYCIGARLLNRLTALEERVGVFKGSALDLPFPDESFEVVWMQNVGMNIAQKRRLYEEIRRVLKPNGRFAFQEMTAGDKPVSCFPLPWASDPADNQLISMDDMRELLAQCGLVTEYFADVSDEQLQPPASGTNNTPSPAPLSLSAYVDNLGLKAENATRSLREREIRFVRGVFRAS